MTGGWLLFIRCRGKGTFGSQKDGSPIEEKSIFAMIAGIILELDSGKYQYFQNHHAKRRGSPPFSCTTKKRHSGVA